MRESKTGKKTTHYTIERGKQWYLHGDRKIKPSETAKTTFVVDSKKL